MEIIAEKEKHIRVFYAGIATYWPNNLLHVSLLHHSHSAMLAVIPVRSQFQQSDDDE